MLNNVKLTFLREFGVEGLKVKVLMPGVEEASDDVGRVLLGHQASTEIKDQVNLADFRFECCVFYAGLILQFCFSLTYLTSFLILIFEIKDVCGIH